MVNINRNYPANLHERYTRNKRKTQSNIYAMVAKITVPSGIRKALNYNEHKVKEGKAECIYAQNFLKEAELLNYNEKLVRFEQLISLNRKASTNTVHISLNFQPDENLTYEKLAEIAFVYMSKIGFGEQPYLVYKHLDAGHPHMHIVTTNIQPNGRRLSLHNIGRNQSNTARKEIEIRFNLTKAEKQNKRLYEEVKPIQIQRINYGKSPVKTSITNVLDNVLSTYKYASLAELNAILKLYNVIADRGREDGIIYKKHGLVYRVLDKYGNKIGVPIKASSIYNKPTLAFLEKMFKENEMSKQFFKKSLKTSIDWVLIKPVKDIEAFKHALQQEKISLIVRQNDKGLIYGLTYIDNNTKCVFNGSDIGKDYSANAILRKCGITPPFDEQQQPAQSRQISHSKTIFDDVQKQHGNVQGFSKVIDGLLRPTEQYNGLPQEFKQKKRRKFQ